MGIVGIELRKDLVARQEPGSGVTYFPNAATQDTRLCVSARGLLLEILSYGDGWNIEASRAEQRKRHAAGVFEEYVDVLLVELEDAGYLTIVRG